MSKKKNKKDAAGAAAGAATVISVGAHPRARASIRRTRAWTALAAFGIVLFVCLNAGVPGQEAALRALVAGLVGNLVGWACALAVWRSLVMAELKVATDAYHERVHAAAEAAAERAAAQAAAKAERQAANAV
jgi:xanthosine utilization system XapX-like protein